jgi:hypothetical protein
MDLPTALALLAGAALGSAAWLTSIVVCAATSVLVDVLFSKHRDMKAARASRPIGLRPMATTATRARSGPNRASMCTTAPAATGTMGWNRSTAASKADPGPCAVSSAPDRRPGSVEVTTNCATTSVLNPITANTSPPLAAGYSSSAAP